MIRQDCKRKLKRLSRSFGKNTGLWLALLMLLVSMSSCNNFRRAKKGKPLINRTPGALIKKNEKSSISYEYALMKMSVDVTDEESAESFKATVKMKKDSVIWISISPALGIEALRVVLTKDSLKYYSKIPDNKHHFAGPFEVLKEKTGINLDFGMLQELILGNAVLLDKGEDKMIAVVDDQRYYLISRFHRRLKKLLGKDEKETGLYEKVEIKVDPFKYEKIKDRSNYEDLVMKRFWMDPYNYKVVKAWFNDYYNLLELKIDYEEFEEEKDQIYPSKARLRIVKLDEEWQEFNYRITKFKLDKETEFNYEVPDGYEQKESL